MKPPHRHRQAQYSGFKHLYRWQFFHFSAGFKAARLWGYLSQGEKRGTMNTDPPQYFAWYWDLRWNNTRLTGLHPTPALNSNNCCVYLFIYLFSYFIKEKYFIFPVVSGCQKTAGRKHGSICVQSGPTIEISDQSLMAVASLYQSVPASFDSRLFNNISQSQPAISTSKVSQSSTIFWWLLAEMSD